MKLSMSRAAYKAEVERDRHISKLMLKEHERRQREVHILLCGRDGASTLLKQIRFLFGTRWDEQSAAELEEKRNDIFRTILTSMASLVEAAEARQDIYHPDLIQAKERVMQEAEQSRKGGWVVMNADLREAIVKLWEDPAIRAALRDGAYSVEGASALEYFMERHERVLDMDFVVTADDWARSYRRRAGLETVEYEKSRLKFKIHDLRAMVLRGEPRKWIHMFDGASGIYYVVPLDQYDERLYEDYRYNRLEEDIREFDHTINRYAICDIPVFLFFSNIALFREKLLRSPVKVLDRANPENNRWIDYNGPDASGGDAHDAEEAFDAALDYFRDKFVDVNATRNRQIYIHAVNMLDSNNVNAVMSAVTDAILYNALRRGSLLGP